MSNAGHVGQLLLNTRLDDRVAGQGEDGRGRARPALELVLGLWT